MKIIYIHQYFKSPSQPGGTRSYWIARELIKDGHDVTMITGDPNAKLERIVEEIDAIEVVYLKEPYDQSMSIVRRLRSFLGFVKKCIKEVKSYRNVDLVIATSTPLTVGIPALYLRWFRKVPYIFEVRDLWPEVPIQMGVFNSAIAVFVGRWFERKVYRNADHVVALSPGMKEGVAKYIARENISMIPNMSKVDKFWPRSKNTSLMKEFCLNEYSFKVVHFGALGLANGLETVIDSATILRDDSSVEFIFLGGGSVKEVLEEKCKRDNLRNVKFLGVFPMELTSEIVNICDVSIVSFKDLPILYTNSPNKLFDSLSAGKPIIVNSAGWTKQLVEDNKCGYYVNPNHPQDLVDKIKFLQGHPDICKKMGGRSRDLAETKYDKSLLCREFSEVVKRVIAKRVH